jgi:hypothetical protein
MATAAGGNNNAIKISRMTAIIVYKINVDVLGKSLDHSSLSDVKFGAQSWLEQLGR